MLSMTTPKLLTCEEGDIALLSMNKEKQLDLDKTDLVPISRASVLLPFSFRKLAESQCLISTKQLDKDGGGKEPVGLADR